MFNSSIQIIRFPKAKLAAHTCGGVKG